MHSFQGFFTRQTGILNHRQLVPTLIHHLLLVDDEAVLLGKVVQLRARVSMRQRYLDGLYIQLLGKLDGLLDSLASLPRQADDEVAVHSESQLLGIAREVSSALHGCALLDVFQDLRIARLVAHDQQAASRLFLCLESFVVSGDA